MSQREAKNDDARPMYAKKRYTPSGGVYVDTAEMMKTRKMDENRRKLRALRKLYGEEPETRSKPEEEHR